MRRRERSFGGIAVGPGPNGGKVIVTYPAFLIRFLNVSRDESDDDIARVRFLVSAERRCA